MGPYVHESLGDPPLHILLFTGVHYVKPRFWVDNPHVHLGYPDHPHHFKTQCLHLEFNTTTLSKATNFLLIFAWGSNRQHPEVELWDGVTPIKWVQVIEFKATLCSKELWIHSLNHWTRKKHSIWSSLLGVKNLQVFFLRLQSPTMWARNKPFRMLPRRWWECLVMSFTFATEIWRVATSYLPFFEGRNSPRQELGGTLRFGEKNLDQRRGPGWYEYI